ncbi:MAG: hypothetical protein E6767_19255 [Dysgonomonas sp.]|nr:hypothetical protein [Dysgonomonas sp.]
MILNNLTTQDDKNAMLAALRFRIYLAPMSLVDVNNYPKAVNATISSNVLLPGAVFKYFDAMVNTLKPSVEPGESPLNGKITLSPSIEGVSKETLQWVYDNQGKRFLVIYERCSDGQRFIAGDPCSGGLKFSYQSIGELENGTAGITTTFEGGECPEPFWFYDGPLPLEDPEFVAADATTFALTSKVQYQLGSNTASKTLTDITGITDTSVGRIIEILGAGASNPTKISSSTKFILKNGIDFTAGAGSRISFLITKTGASSYAFFEVNRA